MNDSRSSETFAIGEVALLWRPASRYHGTEVTVVSELRRGSLVVDGGSTVVTDFYEIDGISPNGSNWAARPQSLRKKRPPREDLQIARWDQCPWQPEKINAA